MITICNTHYLDSSESRKFLDMTHRNWQIYRYRIPFIKHDETDYWKMTDLEDVKDKMDPRKFIFESELILDLETYWLKLKAVVDDLKIERIKHPLHSRMLYRASDIAVIRKALKAVQRKNAAPHPKES